MKIPKYLLLCFAAILLFSCSKKGSASFDVSVTDGRTGNPSGGATIKLYADSASVVNNSPKYTKTTDKAGKASFNVSALNRYYIIVQNGNERNVYDGYIPVGIFKSQQDVANHPIQSPLGVVGGLIFKDVNFDGKIDGVYDKVIAPQINFALSGKNGFDISIY